MYCKTYKNNNVHVYGEPEYDGDNLDVYGVLEALAYSLDCPDVFCGQHGDEYPASNYYNGWYISLWVNGKPRTYTITVDDIDRLNDGKRVVLIDGGETPLFDLPRWYNRAKNALGYFYWLDEVPSDEDMETFKSWGCELRTGSKEYAPEIKRPVLFVPKGLCYYL